MQLVLDADAFNFLRKLGLLDDLIALARLKPPKLTLHTTRYVARFELQSLQSLVEELEKDGTLKVAQLAASSPAFKLFRELLERYDKGESELAAWAAKNAPTAIIVSCDKAVPKLGKELHLQTLDIGELVVVLVKDGLLSEATAVERLRPWENPHTGIGRPTWWKSLKEALAGPHPLS